MEEINHDWEYRFDVISVIIRKGKNYIKHIEDAFWL
jgi:Holliday junction resolvase-like predicted endonuclease